MTTVPSPRTWARNEIPPYDVVTTEVYDTIAWLLQPPTCKLRQTTAQSLPNATFTALTWQGEDTDPWNWHSTTNPSRITPTFPGWYRGWYSIGFTSSTVGNFRIGAVYKNGSPNRSRRDTKPPASALSKRIMGVPFYVFVNGTTDYVEIHGFQDSGSSMTLQTGNLAAEVFLRWWAPL